MSSSRRILIGLGAGVAVGVFLGEHAGPFQWAAEAYVKLLQMTVLPYVTVSIIGGLGKLRPSEARALGVRTGAVLAGLWLVALIFMFLIPLSFPMSQNASFFSTTLVQRPPPFDFIDLYIPANPFRSLADNIVPAVVLFSVLLGVALIGVERKHVLLDLLNVAGEALTRVARMIVRLTPYGLFVIAASAAGTISLDQLGRLQVYLVAYVLVALLLALWVLPALVAALTTIPQRAVFSVSQDALVTAFAAGDLLIVLPGLIESSRTLIERYAPSDREAGALPSVIVPASFNFPHTAKLLSLSFVLFAGWFSDALIRVTDYPKLAFTGLLVAFGSLNSSIPFLLDLFRIPADTFQLFLASSVINRHVGTLLAAMHTVTVGLLGACATAGLLRVRRAALARFLATTAALTITIIVGTRLLFAGVLDPQYTKDDELRRMHLLRPAAHAIVHRTRPAVHDVIESDVLNAIHAHGRLRVGYLPRALPFAFFNERDELVGYDIELANYLASELHVELEFVPVNLDELVDDLAQGYCDIVMSGVPVTTDLASRTLMSTAYLDETLSFVVPDQSREQFATWEGIRSNAALTIAVPDVPYYVEKLRALLPMAKLHVMTDVSEIFTSRSADVDGIALPAERGSAWTLIYPAYTVVVPEPGLVKIPLAYPIARQDRRFGEFVNTWIELKKKDGTFDAMYQYWILGRDREARPRRWSIIRDVLHWVE
jgi:Na+/H+-dicarboxylate symporter/ABC-type amino acid transport substrate-binding protein